jgi:hypothetical protein
LKAANYAAKYLLSKYGSAHLIGEPKVELTATEGPTGSSFAFSGSISVTADSGAILNPVVGVNMTVNENDIEVTSEDIPANISSALNAAEEHSDHVVASLDSFKLTDDGTKYLKLSHSALQDANLGLVGKIEYATSPDKSELLQSMVKDAMLEMPITFTGEFKEPVIEKVAEVISKQADKKCPTCKGHVEKEDWVYCEKCKPLDKVKKEVKKSWLTDTEPPMAGAEFMEYECPVCKETFEDYDVNQHDKACPGKLEVMHDEKPAIAIHEDMPRASMSDSMAQMAQAESQVLASAKDKLVTEAVNSLVAMLHGMGYGTAKVAEVTDSTDGLDIMAAVDDAGAVKAVSIPVAIKDAKVVLPKKSLISALISKGLDIRAKLSEQFDLDVLEKMAAAEEKAAYEAREAEAILAEKPVVKEASGSTNEQFLGETDTLEVQKHLLPNHEEMKKGDKISDGADQWELVDTEGNQNDKNEGSASIWKFKKCAPPKADEKEPETKIKA